MLKIMDIILEGKWAGWVINLGLIPLLIVLSVLLPPVSAMERIFEAGYTTIGREGGAIRDPDGMQLTLLPEGISGKVKIKIESIPRVSFLEGSAGRSLVKAAELLPSHLIMKSPFYKIELRAGREPKAIIITIPIPNDSEPYRTLDLYTWTGEEWQWLPSRIILEEDVIESRLSFVPPSMAVMQTKPLPPAISAIMMANPSLPPQAQNTLVEINPQVLLLSGDGTVAGDLAAIPQPSQEASYFVIPTIRNWGDDGVIRSDLIDNTLVSQELRERHIAYIVGLVVQNMYPGIDIDYRGINPNLRDEYSSFISELAEELHKQQKILTVRVEPPMQVAADRWDTGVYDWRALGQAVDGLKVPAIEKPQAYAPGGQMEEMLSWAVGEVNRYKIQLVISARSIEKVGDAFVERKYTEALEPLSHVEVEGNLREVIPGQKLTLSLVGLQGSSGLQFDEATGTYWYRYVNGGNVEHTLWLENAASIARKFQLVAKYNLRGVAIEHFIGEENDQQIWEVVRQFHNLVVPPVQSQFNVVWKVQDESGGQLSQEMRPLTDPKYTWTAPQKPGEYVIEAAVSADGHAPQEEESGRVALLVIEPTPTPTPIPPTPTPAPTPTPKPAQVAEAPPPQPAESSPPAPAPPPPSAAPNPGFGYGIQAHMYHNDLGPIISAVKGMGFNWVKQQTPWKDHEGSKGAYNWAELDRIADGLNAAGLNVLFSVVKAPAWSRPGNTDFGVEGPPANPQDFADFLGAMAAHFKGRVQAYEVWNEQNLHYEWGNEPLDAARYVQMLKLAYQAIKAADPNAIVVSGALTPTGAPQPWAIDDFTYLEQMYQAGMKDYCDAVGAHPSGYNVPPDADWQTFNEPNLHFTGPVTNRHHSWSYKATMEGYRNIMVAYGDANKTIWPTEFGWASSSSPAKNYEYAADNTLEEQAAYTVKAYQMGKAWGWVGVMFLWNLNFKVIAPGSEMAQWGIVNESWGPLPVYSGLASMPK